MKHWILLVLLALGRYVGTANNHCRMMCSTAYKPVCAKDAQVHQMKTFSSACAVNFINCVTKMNFSIAHNGVCSSEEEKLTGGSDNRLQSNSVADKGKKIIQAEKFSVKPESEKVRDKQESVKMVAKQKPILLPIHKPKVLESINQKTETAQPTESTKIALKNVKENNHNNLIHLTTASHSKSSDDKSTTNNNGHNSMNVALNKLSPNINGISLAQLNQLPVYQIGKPFSSDEWAILLVKKQTTSSPYRVPETTENKAHISEKPTENPKKARMLLNPLKQRINHRYQTDEMSENIPSNKQRRKVRMETRDRMVKPVTFKRGRQFHQERLPEPYHSQIRQLIKKGGLHDLRNILHTRRLYR